MKSFNNDLEKFKGDRPRTRCSKISRIFEFTTNVFDRSFKMFEARDDDVKDSASRTDNAIRELNLSFVASTK